jgi:hypothetical protein
MDTHTDAAQGGGAPSDIVQIPAPGNEALSPREAARTLTGFRNKQRAGGEREPEVPPASDASPETEAHPDAAAPAEETTEAPAEAADAPALAPAEPAALEPPPSWSKEARERWAKLDRDTQDFLRQRESEESAARRKAGSDAQAERGAVEAERRKLEAARAHYESALPNLLAAMQQDQARDFSDIKSIEDVQRLAREDWPRYVLWDAQQKRLAGLEDELKAASARQERERQLGHSARVERELALFLEKAPERADPAQRAKLQSAAAAMLRELGFSEAELGEMWQGRKELSLHDHRLHLLIRDGLRYRDAQKAARDATAKPLPPVQRPGAAQAKGAAQDALVQTLTKRLEQTGKLKDAVKLIAERRRGR